MAAAASGFKLSLVVAVWWCVCLLFVEVVPLLLMSTGRTVPVISFTYSGSRGILDGRWHSVCCRYGGYLELQLCTGAFSPSVIAYGDEAVATRIALSCNHGSVSASLFSASSAKLHSDHFIAVCTGIAFEVPSHVLQTTIFHCCCSDALRSYKFGGCGLTRSTSAMTDSQGPQCAVHTEVQVAAAQC